MGEAAYKFAVICVVSWLIALSYFDIRQRRLPNLLTLPGAAVIFAAAALTGHGVAAAAGATAMFTVYALVHAVIPQAMGAGDVKLAAGVGALTGAFGPDVWLLAALGAPIVTALSGVLRLIGGDRSSMPHGPSMCIAAAGAVAVVLI